MTESLDIIFCKLLRVGLGLSQEFPYKLNEKEWKSFFVMAKQQTVQGIVYNALSRLPVDFRPPRTLTMRLSLTVETIRGQNLLMNQEAARYTQLFTDRGVRSVILKGQANARLYPDPLARQAGDIDIWIPGNFDTDAALLLDMGLISKIDSREKRIHHIGFRSEKNIEIEIHHRLASGMLFRQKAFQKLLLSEIDDATLTPEGFYSPSIRFALLMQLLHLQHHFFYGGLGLRQYMDYYMLLTHSTKDDRDYVWKYVKKFALGHVCAAVMGLLEKAFGLSRELMLCPPDIKRGLRLYKLAFSGGNFGKYASKKAPKEFVLKSWFLRRVHAIQWFGFDPLNTILREIMYWKITISLIPERIRRRKISL